MTEPAQFPKVSIIMPTYNRAEYILETIESIRNQTYSIWELIIVDDGSEDKTEELVAQIGDTRIQFLKAGKVGVGVKLRSIGIDKASGEFIAFMDSDDLWDKEKLERQLKAFNDYPEAAFSLTGGYNFRNLNEPLEYFYKQRDRIIYGNILQSFFNSEVAIILPTLMIRKACLETIRKHVKNSPDSDLEFVIGLAVQFKAVVLCEALFFRRLHQTNFSTVFWQRGYKEMISIIHSYKSQKLISSDLAGQSLFKLYINYGEKHLRYRQRGRAIDKFFRAWLNNPFSIVPLKKTAKAILYIFRNK